MWTACRVSSEGAKPTSTVLVARSEVVFEARVLAFARLTRQGRCLLAAKPNHAFFECQHIVAKKFMPGVAAWIPVGAPRTQSSPPARRECNATRWMQRQKIAGKQLPLHMFAGACAMSCVQPPQRMARLDALDRQPACSRKKCALDGRVGRRTRRFARNRARVGRVSIHRRGCRTVHRADVGATRRARHRWHVPTPWCRPRHASAAPCITDGPTPRPRAAHTTVGDAPNKKGPHRCGPFR